MTGHHPNSIAALLANHGPSLAGRQARAAAGRAYAQAWRARNKPYFDAIYGAHQ